MSNRVMKDVSLSAVELEYLKLFLEYKSVERVAEEKGISARSVCFHLQSVSQAITEQG